MNHEPEGSKGGGFSSYKDALLAFGGKYLGIEGAAGSAMPIVLAGADRWYNVLPLSHAAWRYGLFYCILFSVGFAIYAHKLVERLRSSWGTVEWRLVVTPSIVFFAIFALACIAFYYAEYAWKFAAMPMAELIFFHLVPGLYGIAFGCLAGLATFAVATMMHTAKK